MGAKRAPDKGGEGRPAHQSSPGVDTRGLGPIFLRTCMSTLSLSRGAVQVLDTAPAPPPATRCLHHIPVCLSSTVNSSGTVRFSPTSKICREDQEIKQAGPDACGQAAAGQQVHNLPPSRRGHPGGRLPRTLGRKLMHQPSPPPPSM